MSEEMKGIADKHLGQKSAYSNQYDKSLLVPIPRGINRVAEGIIDKLPWEHGFDVWNCYELSYLNKKGRPVSGIVKIVYSSSSPSIVESKSLKLYLNSFNQTQFETSEVCNIIRTDLSELLEVDVRVNIFDSPVDMYDPWKYHTLNIEEYIEAHYPDAKFTEYDENVNLLVPGDMAEDQYVLPPGRTYRINSTNLFSRCAITHQPDHSNVYITIQPTEPLSILSLAKYIYSFRLHSKFHEPTVESLWVNIDRVLKPDMLMVAAPYTRRGGISICPVRSSDLTSIVTTRHGERLVEVLPPAIINEGIYHFRTMRE